MNNTVIFSLSRCIAKRTAYFKYGVHTCLTRGSFPHVLPTIFQTRKLSSLSAFSPLIRTSEWRQCQITLPGVCGSFGTQHRFYVKKRTLQNPTKPLSFESSGDLVSKPPIDESQTQYAYKDLDLNDAPELVRKMFSLEFADSRERREHRQQVMLDQIEAICGPGPCNEKKIVRMTISIRNLIPHCLRFRHDKINKVQLLEKISKRKRLLRFLRRNDYERFIWLLKELKIKYVPTPLYNKRASKAAARKKAAREAAIALQKEKMDALKTKFETLKLEFLEHKEKTMAEIDETCAQFELDKEEIWKSMLKKQEEATKLKDVPTTGFKSLLYISPIKQRKRSS